MRRLLPEAAARRVASRHGPSTTTWTPTFNSWELPAISSQDHSRNGTALVPTTNSNNFRGRSTFASAHCSCWDWPGWRLTRLKSDGGGGDGRGTWRRMNHCPLTAVRSMPSRQSSCVNCSRLLTSHRGTDFPSIPSLNLMEGVLRMFAPLVSGSHIHAHYVDGDRGQACLPANCVWQSARRGVEGEGEGEESRCRPVELKSRPRQWLDIPPTMEGRPPKQAWLPSSLDCSLAMTGPAELSYPRHPPLTARVQKPSFMTARRMASSRTALVFHCFNV